MPPVATIPRHVLRSIRGRSRAGQIVCKAHCLRQSRRFSGSPSNERKKLPFTPPRMVYGAPQKFRDRSGSQIDFDDQLPRRLAALKEEFRDAPVLTQHNHKDGGKKPFSVIWNDFQRALTGSPARTSTSRVPGLSNLEQLRLSYEGRGTNGLDDRIRYLFYGFVVDSLVQHTPGSSQTALLDLRYPSEWYPTTRQNARQIHLHVGPTNSGKTYHALKRLEQAEHGIYAGPLRLLAHEVYSRMNAKGRKCALITGEERRAAPGEDSVFGGLASCTVEMMPLHLALDVAVIDEIQMLGNLERGWAWTQALLGVRAKEVHLCGEERTVPLIEEICASLGERLEIHRYERLTPLKMERSSLNGNLDGLRKGDCVVSFSVMGIHALRRSIEQRTGKKVAIVYGSLPPETRAQQARLFNDPDNDYDYLVASDAVGMGLNLAIKRIVFETSLKFDGSRQRRLSIADIKQIAGRAGRYRTAAQDSQISTVEQDLKPGTRKPVPAARSSSTLQDSIGYVTTLERFDFPLVKEAMTQDAEPLQSAGLFPPGIILEKFAAYFPPNTPFSFILTRLHEASHIHPRFHLCGLKDMLWIADTIESVKGLTVTDRNVICAAPASRGDADLWRELLPVYARHIAEQKQCSIADVTELPLEVLEKEASVSKEYLRELERLHKGIVTYLWLSYRFAGIFNARALAFHVKVMVEEKIEAVLGSFSFTDEERRSRVARREQQILRQIQRSVHIGNDSAISESVVGQATIPAELSQEVDNAQAHETQLDEQTSLTAGGDHFGGEVDQLGLNEELDNSDDGEKRPVIESGAERQFRRELEDSNEDKVKRQASTDERRSSEGDDDEILTVQPSSTDPMTPSIENEKPKSSSTVEIQASTTNESSVPPKHLAQLDVNATEVERNPESRP